MTNVLSTMPFSGGKSIPGTKVLIGKWLACFLLGISLQAVAEKSCEPRDGMEFLCGPTNAEDLVWLPGTDLMIASGMAGDNPGGNLYLVDPARRTYTSLYPGTSPQAKFNKDMFGNCPGAPDPARFSSHGLSIRSLSDTLHRLYVTAHGERESVEAFEIDTSAATPAITWIGCVVVPDDASINSVVVLEDGGFYTTRISTQGDPAMLEKMKGEISGFLYSWQPGKALVALLETSMSAPNGIDMSRDGKQVYVASWGKKEVVRFSRSEGKLTQDGTIQLDFRPDNLRLTEDGFILAAGHRMAEKQDCGAMFCIKEWVVARIDPRAMTAETLVVKTPVEGFAAATVAVPGAGGLWLGTYRGDRIVFVPGAE